MTVTKSDLVNKIFEKTGFSKKDTSLFIDSYHESVKDALVKGEKVQLVGFGNYEVRERAARKGRNPQTGEEIAVAATKVPAFKAGKNLKDAVNQ